jgi:Domain of unknown function (DUF4190)
MSDVSQGSGWWLASDGKWYPPETWTGPPLPTAVPPGSPMPQPGALPMGGEPMPGSAPGAMPGYQTYQGAPVVAARSTNGMAVASLVCACAGIIPFLFGIPAILGVIFGFVARGQIKNSNNTQGGRGLALAGIIVGFSLIGIFILVVILIATVGHDTTCSTINGNFRCVTN